MAEAIEHNTSERVDSTPRECLQEKQRLLSRVKLCLRAVCRPLQNGDIPLTKRPNTNLNRSKTKRRKFSRTYSTSTSSDSSTSSSESSSESVSERSAKSPLRQNESAFEEPEVSFDESTVTFMTEEALQGPVKICSQKSVNRLTGALPR